PVDLPCLPEVPATDAGPDGSTPSITPVISPDPLADLLDQTPPGPELASLLDSVDLRSCPDDTVVAAAAAASRLQAWSSAQEVRATRALVDRAGRWRGVRPVGAPPDRHTVPADRMAAVEVAAALGLSSRAAQGRVALALELDRAPATRAALSCGQVTLYTARTVLEQIRPLDDDTAAAVEAKVIDRYAGRPHADIARALKRAVITADPAAAEKRRQRGVEDRAVEHGSLDDGMAEATMRGPAEDVRRFYDYVTASAMASKGTDDPRTLAQRRFDVLADLGAVALSQDTTRPDLLCHPGPPCRGIDRSVSSAAGEVVARGHDAEARHPGLPARRLPERKGRRPQIRVVVAATTLLGLDELPGELVGYGPVTAAVARRIASDGTWRRLLTDPRTGRFDELSATTYEPPQDLQDHVTERDGTCIGAGCRMVADRCDLDHRIPHPRGPTSAGNLDTWCRTEHRIKTVTDTVVTRLPDGDRVIRYPSGRSYLLPVDPVLDHPDDLVDAAGPGSGGGTGTGTHLDDPPF
ncbi:MAG TPA: hypothetical protein VFR56_03465, partial [Actinomycetes bacterium]|nr:hypothetical protein [Actinomycetes bacterium]